VTIKIIVYSDRPKILHFGFSRSSFIDSYGVLSAVFQCYLYAHVSLNSNTTVYEEP